MKLYIAKEFSDTPGARYIKQGEFSGEEFRDKLLIKRYNEAKKNSENLEVILDGAYGYPTSFLEEAFGGLQRLYPKEDIGKVIKIISNDSDVWPALISDYIKKAQESH